jgi:short-subunit dehydrogenase
MIVFGATSAIAQAVAREGAARGDSFFLVARDFARVEAVTADLRVRGAPIALGTTADLTDHARHAALFDEADRALGGFDAVLVAHGSLTDQTRAQRDPGYLASELDLNFLSAAHLLERAADRLEERRTGVLTAISSVAGDRGRQSNYAYGAAKAALSTWLSGLRNRLAPAGVAVLTIKPGFVDTPMTARFRKGLLWAAPGSVGRAIHAAMRDRRDVLYAPAFWWAIMALVRTVPERLFKTLKL